jgi:hypothetical protein
MSVGIAPTILKQQGIPPSGQRPTSWQTFLRAHWAAFVAADFFTTEVWTLRGLVTYYTLFVIELHSRRVHIVGSTPHPDEAFMLQIGRDLTDATDGVLRGPRLLICDRDRKWSTAVRHLLVTAGVQVIPLGERHLRRALAEFLVHYHRERNHQGLGNDLIDGVGGQPQSGSVRRHQRVGGLLSYYYRAA